MVKFLIHRPVSVITLTFALLILAMISAQRLTIGLLPDIEIPNIIIQVEREQFTPQEIERNILFPMRRYLSSIGSLEDIVSTADWESGRMSLKFKYGVKMDKAFIETNEMVDLSMNDLPSGMARPRLIKMEAENLPVYYLSLKYRRNYQGSNFLELSKFAEGVLRRRLEQLPEIALVDIHGFQKMQIAIVPDYSKLASLGISQKDLTEAFNNNQIPLTSIKIKERDFQYLVRIGKTFSSVDEIRKTRLYIGSRILSVGDFAKVSLQPQVVTGSFEDNGQSAISMAIIKTSDASISTLEKKLQFICQQVQNERPDITLAVSRDQTQLLRTTLNNLRNSIFIGCFLAIGIVFFFYGQWRIPIIIGIIIPVSLLLSLLIFNLLSISLNMVSISGLLLGLGLMIDNGIIVLDNISQAWRDGDSLERACIRGTNEMIRPLLTSMLTTCSVFFPLLLISGITGALFFDQAISISIGLVVSYLVSITVLPTLYFLLLRRKKVNSIQGDNFVTRFLTNSYKSIADLTFRFKYLTLAQISLFAILAIFLLRGMSLEKFPTLPEKAFEVDMDWNAPIRPVVASQRVSSVLDDIVADWQAHIGLSQYLINTLYNGYSSTASIYIPIKEGDNPEELRLLIQKRFQNSYPEAQINFEKEKNIFELLFPDLGNTLTVRCYINLDNEQQAQIFFQDLIQTIDSLPSILSLNTTAYEQSYLIEPKFDNLHRFKIRNEQLVAELKRILGENQLIELKSYQETVPVVIKSNLLHIESIGQSEYLINPEGIMVPLEQLISIKKIKNPRQILATKDGRYWPIEIETGQPAQIERQLDDLQRDYPFLDIEIVGAYKENQKLVKELLIALLVSILMLYFLLTAQFESFLLPLIILVEIPISLSGSVLLLWLLGVSINIMSLIGMIVTIGIIINDSIIKIDTINRLRLSNLSLMEAIHEGGLKRLNSIVMTSLTTILAVLPFLWGKDLGSILQQPLSLSLIGGMFIGSLVSLFLIPLLYYLITIQRNHIVETSLAKKM